MILRVRPCRYSASCLLVLLPVGMIGLSQLGGHSLWGKGAEGGPTAQVDGAVQGVPGPGSPLPSAEPKKIAAIVTTYFPNSHAGVIVDKFLRGFPTDDGLVAPRMTIASLYIDQIHRHDIGLQTAHKYNVPVFESIRSALTLGGKELAVDAVLLIGEHGDYPKSKLGQEMLPRRYFFEQITGVIGASDQRIPIFSDKFFAYRWDDARWMYETAKELRIPFWAGSAMPVAWRSPNWEHPAEQPVREAVVLGFHMVERYGFHALEILQSQLERRTGGETGVRAVQCLSGDAVWRAGAEGKWSRDLAQAAIQTIEGAPTTIDPARVVDPHVFLIEYSDGVRGTVLMLGEDYIRRFAYAERADDSAPVPGNSNYAALSYSADSGAAHAAFSYLGLNIEDFFLSGTPPSPVERTYLTTGILEAALISRHENGRRIETPHLAEIRYKVSGAVRRPTGTRAAGASIGAWDVLEPGSTPAASTIPTGADGTVRGPKGASR